MVNIYKANKMFISQSLAKHLKTTVVAIAAVLVSCLSYGQCITGGNNTETIGYTGGSFLSGSVSNSADAIDGNFTTTAAGLSISGIGANATLAVNFSKPVNPGDSIYFIIGQGSVALNLSLFGSITGTAYTGKATSSDPSVGTPVGSNSASSFLSLLIIGGVSYQALAIGIDPNATIGASSIALVHSAFIAINSKLDVYGVYVAPGPPRPVNQSICNPGGITTLTATKYTLAGSTIDVQWYKANDTLPSNLVQTNTAQSGTPYISSYTPPAAITATKTYYVRQSTAGCGLYSPLQPVTVTVLPSPTPSLAPTLAVASSIDLVPCGSEGKYISFIDQDDSSKKYMSIDPNGNTGYNFTSANTTKNLLSIVKTTGTTSSVAIGQRLYTVVDAGPGGYTVNGGMKVRIYYVNTDTSFPRSILGTVLNGVLASNWFKVPGLASTLTSSSSSVVTSTGITGAINLNSSATYGTEGAQKYVEFSGIKSFSTFGFVAAKGASGILPVSGLSLSGLSISGVPQLSWTTVTEVNSSYFNIESSTDGSTFSTIGKLAAVGNSTVSTNYAYTDKLATGSIVYYRIKAIDKDGSSSYSNTIAISLGGNTAFKVFPNPASNLLNIQTEAAGLYMVELFSVDGKKVQSAQLTSASNLITLNVNKSSVPAGIYSIKVTNANGKGNSSYATVLIK